MASVSLRGKAVRPYACYGSQELLWLAGSSYLADLSSHHPHPTFAPSSPAAMHSFYPATLAPIGLCHWYSFCLPTTWSFTFYHWRLPDYLTEKFPTPNPGTPPLPFLTFIFSTALWPSTYFYMFFVSLSICHHYNVSHTPHPTPPQISWTDNKTKTRVGK